jgi:hypothetical protein
MVHIEEVIMFTLVIALLELMVGYTYFRQLLFLMSVPMEIRIPGHNKRMFVIVIRLALFLWLGCSAVGRILLELRGYKLEGLPQMVVFAIDMALIILYMISFVSDIKKFVGEDDNKNDDNNDNNQD